MLLTGSFLQFALFEQAKLVEDHATIDILGYSHLCPIELVTADHVQSGVSTQACELVLYFAHDVPHGLALVQLRVVLANN